ncbi:hypothetical protein Focb16_v009788 [Fusarium oxysporum f. sp. cubense]|uniref:Uncharacterized protein n=1 Tax=Fusarium oxysporum f. sp. cubense TaxID=61366 RepID=A0A559LUT4_FUSOC|nr:hypothetical protein Focb16_v009788 [Fusarium oxysporum f. sp. cubense]
MVKHPRLNRQPIFHHSRILPSSSKHSTKPRPDGPYSPTHPLPACNDARDKNRFYLRVTVAASQVLVFVSKDEIANACLITILDKDCIAWDCIKVLNNLSSIAVVKRHTQDGQTYQYLAPSDIPENLRQDYTAITYAMSSECSPLSKVCHLGIGKIGASTPFNCTRNGFSGAITTSIQLQYYTDPNLSRSTALGVQGFHNPFYFIGAAFLPSQWPAPTHDTEIVSEVHGDRSLILRCSTTVYDITYKVVNGSIVHFVPVKSNISATNALQSPIAFTHAADYTLQQAFSFARSSNSAQGMLDTWAPEFDRVAMAMSAAALKGSPATRSRYREPAIVARVPLAPLVCLLLANMLFAVSGFVLAWTAVVAGRIRRRKRWLNE